MTFLRVLRRVFFMHPSEELSVVQRARCRGPSTASRQIASQPASQNSACMITHRSEKFSRFLCMQCMHAGCLPGWRRKWSDRLTLTRARAGSRGPVAKTDARIVFLVQFRSRMATRRLQSVFFLPHTSARAKGWVDQAPRASREHRPRTHSVERSALADDDLFTYM